jgi:hypothetical protein
VASPERVRLLDHPLQLPALSVVEHLSELVREFVAKRAEARSAALDGAAVVVALRGDQGLGSPSLRVVQVESLLERSHEQSLPQDYRLLPNRRIGPT